LRCLKKGEDNGSGGCLRGSTTTKKKGGGRVVWTSGNTREAEGDPPKETNAAFVKPTKQGRGSDKWGGPKKLKQKVVFTGKKAQSRPNTGGKQLTWGGLPTSGWKKKMIKGGGGGLLRGDFKKHGKEKTKNKHQKVTWGWYPNRGTKKGEPPKWGGKKHGGINKNQPPKKTPLSKGGKNNPTRGGTKGAK